MSEISFAPEGLKNRPDIKRPENPVGKEGVSRKKARDKTVKRAMESPKGVRKEDKNSNPAEHLGNFLENVVPKRIAIEIIKEYKEKVDKELKLKGVDKNKYDDPVEYKKSVEEVRDKIAQGFKFFEKKVYERQITRRVREGMITRGEALIKEIELNNVFEGKNIKFVLKEGDVGKKEYESMLKFQEFLPNNMPKIYDFIKLENLGTLIMEKVEDETLEQLSNNFDITEGVLKVKPKIFSDLGKIVAVMDNNNFIHMDLEKDNIMLSKDYIWKIIDFEFSRHHKARSFLKAITYNIRQLDIDKVSDKFREISIKSDFYEGYLLNRDLKGDINYISEEKIFNSADTKKYVKDIIKMINNVSEPTGETRDYLVSLIKEIDRRLEQHGKDEKEVKGFEKRAEVLKNYKKGLEDFLLKRISVK